jgi:transcriptional regulator with XRE-family HTH domain
MPSTPRSHLKQRRLELSLTQTQVAKAASISQPTYQNYEAGTAQIPTANLRKLARALKMTTEELIGKQKLEPVKAPSASKPKEDAEGTVADFDTSRYWGEISLHFVSGNPIVLPISENECERLFSALQESPPALNPFISIFTLSNQIVAVRRSALTDVCLSREEADTYGPEHKTYRDLGVVESVTSKSKGYWEIAECFLSDGVRDDVAAKYGTQEVQHVFEDLDVEWHKMKIDELIANKELKVEDREATIGDVEEAIEHVAELAFKAKWQLSNGKVRKENFDVEDMGQLDWIGQEFEPENPFIVKNYHGGQWHFINPDSLDYISIPAHAYQTWSATVKMT